ncbi:MAG: hypothetical protein ABSE66_09720 [Thermoplasmata archaeon]
MNGDEAEFVETRCPIDAVVIEVRLAFRTSPRKSRYLEHLTQNHPGLSTRARTLIAEDMIRAEKFSGRKPEPK